MEAGRDLDALVAIKVMEWKPDYKGGYVHPPKDAPNRRRYFDKEGCTIIPHYSTSIEAAWEVVESFKSKGWFVKIHNCAVQSQWFALVTDPMSEWTSIADTAPLAICLAALNYLEIPNG